jgi:porin
MRHLLLIVLVVVLAPPVARAGDDATGEWGGVRSDLDAHGVHLDLDYTAEVFSLPADERVGYRGNVDLILTLGSDKLGLWPCGQLFVYGQHAHGHGLSDELGLFMPISNLEAHEFTQLSELWLEQCFGAHVRVRLGKQDANRDFAGPRFAGNFVNSSFGVAPSVPMPSFPEPDLGAFVSVEPTDWLGLRSAVYDGATTGDGGVFVVGALVLARAHSLGVWRHTGDQRSGVFGVLDWLVETGAGQSLQLFVRGGWAEPEPGEIGAYVGGGATAHGFIGANHTVGIGAGHARTDEDQETFVELFCKLRFVPWLTLEPDVQYYFPRTFAAGLRAKLKL